MAMNDTRTQAQARATVRPRPVTLSRRRDDAHSMMLSRVLPDRGISRLDVAAFNSSI